VEVRKFVSELIKTLPPQERFHLADNMRRASRSATRNIAEGYGRFHFKENIRFCRISRGSLHEVIDDLITCRDEKYLDEENFTVGKLKVDRAINILNGYVNYLKRADAQSQMANNQQPITNNQ
jgi:four helix bundle protein